MHAAPAPLTRSSSSDSASSASPASSAGSSPPSPSSSASSPPSPSPSYALLDQMSAAGQSYLAPAAAGAGAGATDLRTLAPHDALRLLASGLVKMLDASRPVAPAHAPAASAELAIPAPDKHAQHALIARRFWCKSAPDIPIDVYLERIHHYCPISPAVYMATSLYIYRLCVVSRVITLTDLNVHRLLLAGLRVASKTLEDINHQQRRFAKVGGLSETELCRLEIGFLFLIDFDLHVSPHVLHAQADFLRAI
ncbi:cyclin-domain-containing protein [Dipodascopsis tothii]|uniref:cyclin-domain-containing protein n=1 Tax=Dipodascopsis tothii TaxID=44089 RepID=UPI0034CFB623